jgi:PilZ domain
MEERRRSPRRAVDGQLATVPAVFNVRVLDISVAGVLLQSSHPVEPGATGRLQLNLDGSPFGADVEVQRIAPADASAGYRLGATFVGLTPELRHLIERFMTQ